MAFSIEEALQTIYKHTPKKSTKLVPLEEALGSILAENIVATHNLPPYNNSAMDGYALKLSDAGKKLSSLGVIYAGDEDLFSLKDGACVKIMTGAKIPDGADVVVPVENTTQEGEYIITPTTLKPSQHIRFMGEDIESGTALLEKGDELNAHKITLLASQGVSHIKVYKRPHIALFGSGNELKMHFELLQGSQLYNTNSPTLLARAKELGCEVEFLGTAKDSLEDIQEHIKSALDCDLIITSGGVSVGDADYTKKAFEPFGYEIYFDKVDIKPGKPTTFAHIGNTMVLNLPGNPLAAALNFELFGKAIIYALSAKKEKFASPLITHVDKDVVVNTRRRTLIPGYFDGESFTPEKKYAPGMVSPLAKANGFIIVEGGVKELTKTNKLHFFSTHFSLCSEKQKEIFTS